MRDFEAFPDIDAEAIEQQADPEEVSLWLSAPAEDTEPLPPDALADAIAHLLRLEIRLRTMADTARRFNVKQEAGR